MVTGRLIVAVTVGVAAFCATIFMESQLSYIDENIMNFTFPRGMVAAGGCRSGVVGCSKPIENSCRRVPKRSRSKR